MWPYWALFLFAAIFALREARATAAPRAAPQSSSRSPVLLVIPVLTLLVGWRHEVGGDWNNYVARLSAAEYSSIADVFEGREPGFELLQWLAIETDWGIHGVNFIAGAFFSIGLAVFCRSLPRPWLALVVATPYMIIVVAMGYTRQGLALGLCMLGLVALGRQRVGKFVFWVALASTFHNSAILLLPIAVLASTRRRAVIAIVIALGSALAYFAAFQESLDAYAGAYLSTEMASEGALVRLSMNLLPALVVLRWPHRFAMTEPQLQLWRWFSIISVALFVAFFVTAASTALDRIALYMLPLQLVVLTHLPEFRRQPKGRGVPSSATVPAIVGYCAAVQFVWLNYATFAAAWLPYQFFLIAD
jgi:hypothetical protein